MSVESQIIEALNNYFDPSHLEVKNTSYLHAGHGGDDGSGESHFSIHLVSSKFMGINRVERHQLVYDVLQETLDRLPHALSLKLEEGAQDRDA